MRRDALFPAAARGRLGRQSPLLMELPSTILASWLGGRPAAGREPGGSRAWSEATVAIDHGGRGVTLTPARPAVRRSWASPRARRRPSDSTAAMRNDEK